MTDNSRETRVLGAVVTLVDSLLEDFDIVELLTDLTEQCAQLLDVAAAGLLLAGPRHDLQFMAATSPESRHLEMIQLQAEEGPCRDCYLNGQPVSAPNLVAETARWPRFVDAAVDAGFASVHAVPMRAAGTVLGALGLFGVDTGELGDADLLVAQTLAHIASVAILQEHAPAPTNVLSQLKAALASRVVVEQAKGFVRERFDLSLESAFVVLRRYAATHDEHLTEVARRLVSNPDQRQDVLDGLDDLITSP